MEYEKQKEAIKLRKEQGCSLNEISRKLGVARSSVSNWVKGIELTKEQLTALKPNNQKLASVAYSKKRKAIRLEYAICGQQMINDPLFVQGCMLYWGEGGKSYKGIDFTNSDVYMIRLFLKFLQECFGVLNNKIRVSLTCYDDLHSIDEIKNYWTKMLNLPESCFTNIYCNNRPISSQGKRKKSDYGTCKIRVHSIELLYKVFGGIQEISGYDYPEWVKVQ